MTSAQNGDPTRVQTRVQRRLQQLIDQRIEAGVEHRNRLHISQQTLPLQPVAVEGAPQHQALAPALLLQGLGMGACALELDPARHGIKAGSEIGRIERLGARRAARQPTAVSLQLIVELAAQGGIGLLQQLQPVAGPQQQSHG